LATVIIIKRLNVLFYLGGRTVFKRQEKNFNYRVAKRNFRGYNKRTLSERGIINDFG
jgi:hypothetical protein